MVVTKKTAGARTEARADTSTPDQHDLQALAQAGYDEANGIQPAPEPTSYRYVGGLNAVLVVIGDTSYDFRKGDPVHLAHPNKGLDENPDFERVEEEVE